MRRRLFPECNIQKCFCESQHTDSVIIRSKLYTRTNGMPEAIWIDRSDELPAIARTLQAQPSIGVDTEFLRERTFFPKLCLLQLSAAGQIWCVDTLKIGSLEPLMPVLTAPGARKLIHAARQDLEAVYLTSKQVLSPVFDTQIAAACIGLKPQVGYAELVKSLLDVAIPKGQTRTDWSKQPMTCCTSRTSPRTCNGVSPNSAARNGRARTVWRFRIAISTNRILRSPG